MSGTRRRPTRGVANVMPREEREALRRAVDAGRRAALVVERADRFVLHALRRDSVQRERLVAAAARFGIDERTLRGALKRAKANTDEHGRVSLRDRKAKA
jgi:hypothetical protein